MWDSCHDLNTLLELTRGQKLPGCHSRTLIFVLVARDNTDYAHFCVHRTLSRRVGKRWLSQCSPTLQPKPRRGFFSLSHSCWAFPTWMPSSGLLCLEFQDSRFSPVGADRETQPEEPWSLLTCRCQHNLGVALRDGTQSVRFYVVSSR